MSTETYDTSDTGPHLTFSSELAIPIPAGDIASGTDPIGRALDMPALPVGTAMVAVLTYNILAGGGKRMDNIERVIRATGADLIGLQEALRPDLVEGLAQRLGMHYALARSPTGFHVAALSRWPILEASDEGSGHMDKALLQTLIELPGGGRLRFFVTHLSAAFSLPWAGEGRRLREIAHVLERMRAARTAGEPHLLVGDLNSLAPGEWLSATPVLRHALAVDAARRASGARLYGQPGVDYILPPPTRRFLPLLKAASASRPLAWLANALIGLYVPRAVVRRLRGAGYADCYAALHPDPRTRGFTCPAQAPAGRIDYLFADPVLAERLVACEILGDAADRPVSRASDHRPVLAWFRLDA